MILKKKAIKLLLWADKLGFKWASNDSYIKDTKWSKHKQDTCYCLARGAFCSKQFCSYSRRYEVLSFEEALISNSNSFIIIRDF